MSRSVRELFSQEFRELARHDGKIMVLSRNVRRPAHLKSVCDQKVRGSGEPNGSEPHVSKTLVNHLLNLQGIFPFPHFVPLTPFASL